MTTTPAMPELTPLTGDILIQDRTIYVLNKNGENAWWATVYPGFHDNGIRVSEDQCRAVAADLARLAALQSQPAEVSDEPELASKVVNDSCWNFVEAMPHHLPGPIWNDLKPAIYAALIHYHRAILALRPQAVPMTEDTARLDWLEANPACKIFNEDGEWSFDGKLCLDLRDAIDNARGITAQGAQAGEG